MPSTANYQFPYFYDANGTDGPNTKFHNFVTGQNGNYEGIYDTSATPALNRSPYGA
ncbi:hypothetical protein FACS189459_0220 [Bacilli bacterium]|nr:hypothetical protein FACS189459_0220 [Bacilli bacterium]